MDIFGKSITQLRSLIKDKKVSPKEVWEYFAKRSKVNDEKLDIFITRFENPQQSNDNIDLPLAGIPCQFHFLSPYLFIFETGPNYVYLIPRSRGYIAPLDTVLICAPNETLAGALAQTKNTHEPVFLMDKKEKVFFFQ